MYRVQAPALIRMRLLFGSSISEEFCSEQCNYINEVNYVRKASQLSQPLRLGISGSSFAYVMPKELVSAAYANAQSLKPQKFDDRQNALMADFMRNMMRTANSMQISAMECYHSVCWDNEPILDVMLENPNVEFWSVHAPYGKFADPSSPDPAIRKNSIASFTDAINVGTRLGAKVIVSHPGAQSEYDMPKQQRMELSADTLAQVADIAGEHGLKIAVEPLPKQEVGCSLDEVLWIIGKIDRPNVGINFDVNHLFPPENIPALIRNAGKLILSMHISDQDGQERHWLPFQGTLDWQAIIETLTEIGYTGPLMYETHIKEAQTCDDVGRAVVDNYKRLISLA